MDTVTTFPPFAATPEIEAEADERITHRQDLASRAVSRGRLLTVAEAGEGIGGHCDPIVTSDGNDDGHGSVGPIR